MSDPTSPKRPTGPQAPGGSSFNPAAKPKIPDDLPPPRPPLPTDDGYLSTQAKISLADIALQLRDEQLEARIVHYRDDLETNAELDAITAQVVSELRALQRQATEQRVSDRPPADRTQVEIELIQSLKEMLGRLFRSDRLAIVFERRLAEVSKRFARLFFKSELHEKLAGAGGELKTMRYPQQALYHLFARHEDFLLGQLRKLNYASNELYDETVETFTDIVKELRSSFLSKTTPELNELMAILHELLREFLVKELPHSLGELAWEVVKEARLADARQSQSYKIAPSHFPAFRQAFERRFLQRLVPFVADKMLARVRGKDSKFRVETQRFVADPHIFSDVCEVICDSVYDTLCNDGFLDLPVDWRQKLVAEG